MSNKGIANRRILLSALFLLLLISSLELYGIKKVVLHIQNLSKSYDVLYLNGLAIKKPKDWLMYYSKLSEQEKVKLYGLFPFSVDGGDGYNNSKYYMFIQPESENRIIFSKMNNGEIYKINKLLDLNKGNRCEQNSEWENEFFKKHNIFVIKTDAYYSIYLPDIQLNIKTNACKLLNNFVIREGN